MKRIQTTVYTFSELSDKAKDKAREWWRKANEEDNTWHTFLIEEWKERILPAMGWCGADIGYSGFCSQGDGAHFTGEWRSCNVNARFLEEQEINDEDLLRFFVGYAELAKRYPNGFCKIRHSGHYQHENCTDFDIRLADENDDEICGELIDNFEREIAELSRDVMRHIYRCLEKEWEWQNADEQVDEILISNEYTFTESGERFG